MQDLKDKIIQAKNSFGEQAIDIIVEDLNIDQWDESNKKGICPFHTKDGSPEGTPSFKWNPKDSAFMCFGCGTRYGIVDHYKHQGMSFKSAVKKLFTDTSTKHDFGETVIRDYRYPEKEQRENMDSVYNYLALRKISKETVDRCDVAQDSRGNIVFEFYDQNDTLLTSKYRPSRKVEKGETKTWCQKDADTSHILFNMNRCSFDKPLLVCEGETEVLSAIEAGYTNAVSIPFGANNYHWIEKNWEWLDTFDSFIVLADNDEAGKKMLDEVIPRLGEWRCKTIDHPKLKNGNDANDLNEILYYFGREGLVDIISRASDVPITNVADLADIPDIDLSTAGGIKSGIKELDKRIGKFYFGTLAVHTGINGSGKSTFLNQVCVAEPTNQGYKSFLFSGELTPPQLRNWIEYPMAGGSHIEEHQVADDQPVFFKVKPESKALMREWYRGKVFIYTDEIDKSAGALLEKMEVMARKYGVKNFLIDNLMTVDISEYRGDSDFVRQKLFTIDLLRFALKYNVVVHLVAHPRKLDFIKRLTKMDVSGSGDITNLAHYVLAIHRVTPSEKEGIMNAKGDYVTEPTEWDAILDLFKNRPIGFQDVEFGLYFDRKSKRFYKDNTELFKQYGWDDSKIVDFGSMRTDVKKEKDGYEMFGE